MKESPEYQAIAYLFRHSEQLLHSGLEPQHFEVPLCRDSFVAIKDLIVQGRAPDVVTVSEMLPEHKDGLLNLLDIIQIFSDTHKSNFDFWVRKVIDDYRKRSVMDLLNVAVGTINDGKDIDSIRSRLITRLMDVGQSTRTFESDSKSVATMVVDRLQTAHDLYRKGGIAGVPSGIPKLDKYLGGFHRSDLTIVGARTAVGKTAFALSLALNASLSKYRVGFVSSEMSSEQIGMRLTTMLSGVPNHRLRSGNLTDHEYALVDEAVTRISHLPIRYYDKPSCTVSDIAVQARAWQLGGGLDIIYVDYLTRLTPDESHQARSREVGLMIKALKTLALSLNVPIVCLAQVNRESDSRTDKRPMLIDLRDSGEIEQEADCVILLYRNAMHEKTANETDAEILIEKNRHGPCLEVKACYDGNTMTWTEREHIVNYGRTTSDYRVQDA